MKNHAFVAGILTIISGAFGVLWLPGSFLGTYMVRYMFQSPLYGEMPDVFIAMMSAWYLFYGIAGTALGILGITGGILALKKKRWGWAVAGAIAGVITFFPTGIAAIILVSMGREEFEPPGKNASNMIS